MSLHLERKYKINSFLNKKFIPSDFFDEDDIINRLDEYLQHFQINGTKHYSYDQDWKILEKYYDDLIDKLLCDLEISLNDKDQEIFIEWVNKIY